MLGLKQVHHIAIIATDYAVSKAFYCDILGFDLLSEVWREERDSWKGDLALNGQYVIELFSFPSLRRVQADLKLRPAPSGFQRGKCGKRRCASGKASG
ncbi:lyase [Salmonella enterica subsp. enterica]|uniref:Lyase n=1 Tax=Salmonella enterica I TaxID=59201 RepID=A0A379WED3_SALET|nr:lyase [Salmonella enterica subsp. enterica]